MTFQPILHFHFIITGLAAALIVSAACWWFYAAVWKRTRVVQRLAIVVLHSLAAICFTLAAWNPVKARVYDAGELHLAVVLDVSDSVLRADTGWPGVAAAVRGVLADGMDGVPDDIRTEGSASLVTFRGGVALQNARLHSLLTDFDHLQPDDFAGGDGSDIGRGLLAALDQIRDAGGRGEVLLVSDGNDTENGAIEAARLLGRQGIPINVLPVESASPELAIASAYLPTNVQAGTAAYLRGVTYNRGNDPVTAVLYLFQNPDLDADAVEMVGPAKGSEVTYDDLNAGAFHTIREPIVFEGLGLQFADLILEATDAGAVTHRRRIFTHVDRPIRLLAVGGDYDWIAALAPDFAEITPVRADELVPDVDLTSYDAIILSATPASAFGHGVLEEIARVVEDDGVGLFLINGDHSGSSEETPTVLSTYTDTPLEPLLPVSTEPRPMSVQPARHVVIVMDGSGSMSGWPIEKSKEIALYIVQSLLTEQDVVDVISFTTSANHLVKSQGMNDAGKQNAIRQINSIQSGGGTDPKDALSLIVNQQMTNCGLVFISDGYFSRDLSQLRPDCRATVFMVGSASVPAFSPLHDLADPFGVDSTFDPASIAIPYFEPEERDKFFEPGSFAPLSTQLITSARLPTVPEILLDGAAISYLKDGVQLAAVRPKYIDPVLVYGQAELGVVGVFTAGLTPEWTGTPDGQRAVEEWIEYTVPYSARDRYTFSVTDNGHSLQLRVEIQDTDGTIPRIEQLNVSAIYGDAVEPVVMEAVDGAPSTFEGVLSPVRTDETYSVNLELREHGLDALGRSQRIPMLIPHAAGFVGGSSSSEEASYGLNEPLLQWIAEVSGGVYEPTGDFRFFSQPTITRRVEEYWPWFVAIGAFLYWLGIAVQRMHELGLRSLKWRHL